MRELLAALAEGSVPINGHIVGALPITAVDVAWGRRGAPGAHVRWSWKDIPSDVGPGIIQAAKALWEAGIPLALGGAWGHRDARGPEDLWDVLLVLVDGKVVDVAESLWLIDGFLRRAPAAVQPHVRYDDEIEF